MKIYCFIFFLIGISFSANSQKTGQSAIDSLILLQPNIKIDSLKVNNLILISQSYISINPDLGLIYGNKSLQLATNINWKDGIGQSLRIIGQNYISLGNLKKADFYFEKAIKFTVTKLSYAKLYAAKGSLEAMKSNHSAALENFLTSLKIYEDINNKSGIARSYYGISFVYNYLKNNDKAFIYNQKSVNINLKLNLKKDLCDNYILFGEIYRDKNKQYDVSLYYFFKALKLSEQINEKRIFAHVNSKISQIYQLQDKYELALKHVLIAKKNALEIKDYRLIAGSKLDEGLIYLLQFEADGKNSKKQFLLTQAEMLILESLALYKKSGDNFNISVCYDTLTYLYQLQNKDKKATLMALKFAAIKDSIFTEQSKETVKNLEDQRTIELKNKEILINKITLESKEKQKWIYIFGIGFLSIFGFSLFYQNQNRKKTNQKLQVLNQDLDQANKTKIKFLSILNHDLRSPVYNFIHFMQLQKESPELLDTQTKNEIEEKTILSAENLLFSMEDILLWSKGQMDNFKPEPQLININNIFEYSKNHFKSEDKILIIFENPNNISIFTDENFLKTIVRNFTGNAIKALVNAKKPIIVWKAWQEQNVNYLSITDNGAGANEEKFKALYDDSEVIGIQSGLGLHLIRDLAKAIDCEISVDTKIGVGTTFLLKMK